MNAHAGWGTDGRCVLCGDDNSNPDVCIDPQVELTELRSHVLELKGFKDQCIALTAAARLAREALEALEQNNRPCENCDRGNQYEMCTCTGVVFSHDEVFKMCIAALSALRAAAGET